MAVRQSMPGGEEKRLDGARWGRGLLRVPRSIGRGAVLAGVLGSSICRAQTGTLGERPQLWLAAHNYQRCLFGLRFLEWDDAVATGASVRPSVSPRLPRAA